VGTGWQAQPAAPPSPFSAAGKTLNVFMFDHPYPRASRSFLPQFTELTGHQGGDRHTGFLVYNQRADLRAVHGLGRL
jgi:hypothetical protein